VHQTANGQNFQLFTIVGPTVDEVRDIDWGISFTAAFVESMNKNIKIRSGGWTSN